MDARDRYIARVVKGKTFAEVGGLWGTVNEKISIAHRCNAASLTMIDAADREAGSEMWQAFHDRMASFNITDYRCFVGDICQLQSEVIAAPFDIVHCGGVLYHHPHPMQVLVALHQITRSHLILTSAITQEVIENEEGRYQIPPSGVIFLPALNQKEANILRTYWNQFCAVPPIGIAEKIAYHLNDFSAWWWLPTAAALKSMCEVAGFEILESESAWWGNTLTLLLQVQDTNPTPNLSSEAANSYARSSRDGAIDQNPERQTPATTYQAKAYLLRSQGQLQEAKSWYTKAVELDQTLWRSYQELGQILQKEGHFSEGITCFEKAIRLNPDSSWSYHFLGESLTKLKRFEGASAALRRAILLNPFFESYYLLGYALFQQGQFDEAIGCCQTAIQLNPSYAWSYHLMGETFARQGRFRQAIEAFRDAIRLNPNIAWSYYCLAGALMQEQQFDEATLCYQKGIALRGWRSCLEKDYRFSSDWFTHNLSTWENHLKPFINAPIQFLEIGSFQGMATCWLLDHILTHSEAKITCVDLEFQVGFDSNIAKTGALEKVEKRTGNSHDVLAGLSPNAYDVIYIDGCHRASHVQKDASLSWKLLKVGGLMIFDDYEFTDPTCPEEDPKLGIDAFLADRKQEIEVLHQAYQVFVRKIAAV